MNNAGIADRSTGESVKCPANRGTPHIGSQAAGQRTHSGLVRPRPGQIFHLFRGRRPADRLCSACQWCSACSKNERKRSVFARRHRRREVMSPRRRLFPLRRISTSEFNYGHRLIIAGPPSERSAETPVAGRSEAARPTNSVSHWSTKTQNDPETLYTTQEKSRAKQEEE